MSLPRVVIVDDHALFREGVRSRIGDEVEIVGEAGTVDDALAVIHAERPDVVLLDVHMPDGGGLAVLARVLPEEAKMAVHYELAAAHEAAGNRKAALDNFMEVYGSNIDYRDVAERIKALKG